jgi:16S rRNA (guanine966-N2)-methyltransferase
MRIIAGRFRGRRLDAPRGRGTRPTAEQVREAIFSILGDVSGAIALDLYAGSGALGLEALSRGAARCSFVEASREAVRCLGRNVARLDVAAEADIVAMPVERALVALAPLGPFDLVLCDPPWTDMPGAQRGLRRLLPSLPLATGARLVLGHPKHDPIAVPTEPEFELSSRRTWGDAGASFFVHPGVRSGDAGPPP